MVRRWKEHSNNLLVKYSLILYENIRQSSAGGKANIDRDQNIQGIFPIRGKIINAFKASKTDFFNNEEVQGITQIVFGQEYRKGLTAEDAKVEKIIFLSDGDADGNHIAALLLRMFLMYFPFLIEAGMVYRAVPPLYSIKNGKKKKYFVDNLEWIKYVQKIFLENNDLRINKKNAMTPRDLNKFFLRNADYIYFLEKTANTYAVDPNLLELVLIHYISNNNSIKYDKLKKEVTSSYRFMDVYKEGKVTVVRGTIDKSNLIIISDKFLEDCKQVLDIMFSNDSLYYLLNNKKVTLYSVMKAYESCTPSGRQRYKGLGEMDDGELGESTLRPDSDRTLIRYTIENAKEAIAFVREYESDTKKILKHTGIVTRQMLED